MKSSEKFIVTIIKIILLSSLLVMCYTWYGFELFVILMVFGLYILILVMSK